MAVDPNPQIIFEQTTQQQLLVRSICVGVQGFVPLVGVTVSKVGRYAYALQAEGGGDDTLLVVEVAMQV